MADDYQVLEELGSLLTLYTLNSESPLTDYFQVAASVLFIKELRRRLES